MGKKNDKWVKCYYCGEEIPKKEATYLEGRPYCQKCYSEAETYVDLEDDADDDDDFFDDNDDD
jgi:RNA polymerase-binding transcription factor DksA